MPQPRTGRRQYATSEFDQGSLVEVYCTSGLDDGLLLGYLIRRDGKWDGWQIDRFDGWIARKVAIATSRERAAKLVAGVE